MSVRRINRAGRDGVAGARDVLPDIRRLVAAGDYAGAESCLLTVDRLLNAAMRPEETLPRLGIEVESVAEDVAALRAKVAEIRASYRLPSVQGRTLTAEAGALRSTNR